MINKKTNSFYNLGRDLFIRILPFFLVPKSLKKRYHFCFLGHPRDYNEIYRKYPFFSYFPEWFMRFLTLHIIWPTTISDITGLKSVNDGVEIRGCVISVPVTSLDLLKNRKRALNKIKKTVLHAKKQGVEIIGLAGYISSLTKGGLDLSNMRVGLTTGHAYTTLNIVRNYYAILKEMKIEYLANNITIAILGAAGSVGSSVAKYLVSKGIMKVILIDLERKIESLNDLKKELLFLNKDGDFIVTSVVSRIKESSVVFTTTNASEALVTEDLCEPGMIFIDDTHPKDISKNVHYLNNILVLEAGVVNTPGVVTHFNFGLKNKNDNFCCMAELLALSAIKHKGNYVINRTSLDQIYEIEKIGDKLGFSIGEFQNFYGTVTPQLIRNVGILTKERILKNK